MSLAYHLAALEQELVWRVGCYVDAEARLKLVEFLLDFQRHIRNLVGNRVAVAVDSAQVDVGEVVVGT